MRDRAADYMSASLPCPACGSALSGVTDSRPSSEPLPNVRRRRKCLACDHRFTTRELFDDLEHGFHTLLPLGGLSPETAAALRALVRALRT